jgi:hypothetical protein
LPSDWPKTLEYQLFWFNFFNNFFNTTLLFQPRHAQISTWSDQWNRIAPVFPVHPEIRVQGEYGMTFMQLSHAYQTGIGQRHGLVAVFLAQCRYVLDVIDKGELDFHGSIPKEAE